MVGAIEELRDAEVLTAERVTALHPELTWGAYCAEGGADQHFPHREAAFVVPTGADFERITGIVSDTSEAALGWNRDGSLGDVYLGG